VNLETFEVLPKRDGPGGSLSWRGHHYLERAAFWANLESADRRDVLSCDLLSAKGDSHIPAKGWPGVEKKKKTHYGKRIIMSDATAQLGSVIRTLEETRALHGDRRMGRPVSD